MKPFHFLGLSVACAFIAVLTFRPLTAIAEPGDGKLIRYQLITVWIFFALLAVVFYVCYWLRARDPGNVSTPDDLKNLDKNPQFHMQERAEQIANQLNYLSAQKARVVALHDIDETGTDLQHKDEIKSVMHAQAIEAQLASIRASQVAKATHDLTIESILPEASRQQLDVPTLMQTRLLERTAQIEVDKHVALKKLELESKAQEINMDITAGFTVALKDKHEMLHIQDQVLMLIEKVAHVKASDKSEEVKQAQIEVLSETIDGLKKELRGLLQGDSRKELQGGDEDSEGQPVS